MNPRRSQSPVHFRSDKAAAILRREGRHGLSQARLVEDALEDKYGPAAESEMDIVARMRAIKAIIAKVDRSKILSMKEFDALEYDEFGDPR